MNNKELLKELEKRMARYGYCDTQTHIGLFIKEYEALIKKDEKPIRLKDVIKRIKEFDDGTKFKWTYDILKELGSNFGSIMFHEGYQQGKFEGAWVGNQLKDADKIRQELNKPVVPQCVADWISFVKTNGFKFKNTFGFYEEITHSDDVYRVIYYLLNERITDKEIKIWVSENIDTFARAWIDGYKVEKEKRYLVKVKGICGKHETLNCEKRSKEWLFSNQQENSIYKTKHTRKELEDAGFGEVFNSPLFEVKEVTE